MRRADRITGVLTLLAGVFVSLVAADLRLLNNGVPGPGLLPLICGLAFVGFGVALLLRPADAEVPIAWPRPRDGGRVLGVFAALVAFTAIVPVAGFLIATAVFLSGMMWWGGRYALWASALGGVGLALVMMLIFQVLLSAPLPEGVWR